MAVRHKVSIIARRLAIRKSRGEGSAQLIGNALSTAFPDGQMPDGFEHARFMEEAMGRLAHQQTLRSRK